MQFFMACSHVIKTETISSPHIQALQICSILRKCHRTSVFGVGFGIKTFIIVSHSTLPPSPLTFTPSLAISAATYLCPFLAPPPFTSNPAVSHPPHPHTTNCSHLFMKENFPVFSFHLSSGSTNPLCSAVPLRQEV